MELNIGTVGPNARAKEVQDFVHDIKGVEQFQGWDSQIPNEVTVNLFFSQKRRLTFLETGYSGFSVDGFGEWGFGSGEL